MKKIILFVLSLLAVVSAVFVPLEQAVADNSNLAPSSKQALIMDYNSGKILYEHDSTTPRPIASMVKIMTLLCVYDAIDSGKISLDDPVTVSERAASMGGSQVFLDANSTHRVEDLIKSIIVCSANDSCVALAEHVCGSVEAFVDQMNDKAELLGLVSTNFVNCTGLPAVNQFSCAVDVAVMMRTLIKYPNYFKHSGIWLEDYLHPDGRKTTITNTNKLSRFYQGCDGGKTGFTQEAMHCLCATAMRNGTRYIAVVVGAPDSQTRFAEVAAMLNYAFANYQSKVFYAQNDTVGEIQVKNGKYPTVEAVTAENLSYLTKRGEKQPEVSVEMDEKVIAPTEKGTQVGKVYLVLDGAVVGETALVTASEVPKKTYLDSLREIIEAN